MDATLPTERSWWREYAAFLDTHSSPAAAPPHMGNAIAGLSPLEPAPGTYVMPR